MDRFSNNAIVPPSAGYVAVIVLVVGWSTSLSAQSTPTPPAAQKVLSLVTERVQLDADDDSSEAHFWWSTPASPAWTESDRRIRRILSDHHVGLVDLSGDVAISKIYRRASLSRSNAATLGSLVGAKRVLVGDLSYRRLAPAQPMGLERVSARAEVELVAAEAGSTAVLHRFSIERDGFAPTVDDALSGARQAATSALATLVAATLMRGPGPIGVDTTETLIGLHNAENDAVVEQIRQFLESLDGVDRVGVRWAAEGMIALEVNPGRDDRADTVDFALRALTNQSFETFSLTSQNQPQDANLAEIDVSLTQQETGF